MNIDVLALAEMKKDWDMASIDSAVNQARRLMAQLDAPLLTMDLLRSGIRVVEQWRRAGEEQRRVGY